VPNIYRLADDGFSVTLTISLHAPTDALRKTIMPIANAYSIEEILKACDYYFDKTGRRICFEYSLIGGVNDTDAAICTLAKILQGRPCHVNLIPLNSVKEKNLIGTARKKAYQIAVKLEKMGISATVRRTMGEDIEGACGQLRNKIGGANE
jgi:23S rRNA (adenine2503-C2)-methyltransferase